MECVFDSWKNTKLGHYYSLLGAFIAYREAENHNQNIAS